MAFEQLLDRRGGPRAALLVDLHDEPSQSLLGVVSSRRPSGDDLPEEMPSLRQRVHAHVDRDAEGTAGQLLDLATLAGPSSRRGAGHGARIRRLAPRM